jgi:hypothetical protein
MSTDKQFATDVSQPPSGNAYPSHNVAVIVCDPGEHDLVDGPAPYTKVCEHCGYGLGTLVDLLGHDPRGTGGASDGA